MRRALLVVLAWVLLLTACGQKAPTWQEQYDLGIKYLTEGNYEEAIIAFTAAIDIDPKRPEAYAGLSDAYTSIGDVENAKKALEDGFAATGDEALKNRLGEDTPDPSGQEEILDEHGRVIRTNYYDMDGTLEFYTVHTYDETGDRTDEYEPDGTLRGYALYYSSEDGLHFYSENFSSDGTSLGKSVRVEDENGQWLYSASLDAEGNEESRFVAVYNENGEGIGWDSYDGAGNMTGYARYEGDSTVYYKADGTPESWAD